MLLEIEENLYSDHISFLDARPERQMDYKKPSK
jgi:hypothetical protein